ncbi:MAG: hypothetical protein HQL01_07720 [Nitrospirae bacterium]|nr:hypothetical protein [Nitrospirota bacterium]
MAGKTDFYGSKPFLRRLSVYIIITLILWILSISIVLHNQEIIVLAWQRKPISNSHHIANYTYESYLEKNAYTPPSASKVFENGVPLGPGNSNGPSISCIGRGRYQFRYDRLHFSTSDNTDPAANGRLYEIQWPFPIPPFLRWFIFTMAIAASAITYYYLRKSVKALIERGSGPVHNIWGYLTANSNMLGWAMLSLSFGVVIVSFLITRLPYYLYYPVVSIEPDTIGYLEIVEQIDKGMLPSLYRRTPGYPLFIKLIFLFSNKLFSVVIAQGMLALISSLVFVWAIFKTYRNLTISASIALAAFISSSIYLELEVSILSESIFVSVLVLSFAFFILSLKLKKSVYFILFSTASAYAIYIRPAGIFLIVIFALTLIYVITNRYARSNLAALALPFTSLLLVLAIYNLFTFHTFSLSNYGEITALILNATLMEQDDGYSKELNEAIKKIRDRSTPNDRKILETSWDIEKYSKSMVKALDVGGCGYVSGQISNATGNPGQKTLSRISRGLYIDIIKKNPYQFFRKTLMTFLAYLNNISKENEIYSTFNRLYNNIHIKRNTMCSVQPGMVNTLCKEYANPKPLPYFIMAASECGDIVYYTPTFIQRVHYKIFSKLHKLLFRNLLWPIINFIIFGMSVFYLIRSKFSNTGAFILFIMSSSAILSALVIGLSAHEDVRFSYTTEFIYYTVAALLPILWKKNITPVPDGEL